MQTDADLYTNNQAAGVAGMLADTSLCDVISRINGEAAAVGFGLGVVDTDGESFEELDAAHKDVAGVTLYTHAADNADLATAGVPVDYVAPILTRGRVFVTAETTVTVGADAYCRFANGVAVPAQVTKGGWGANDDTNTRRHVKGAKFRTAGSAGDIVVLELGDGLSGYDLMHHDAAVGALAATTTIQLGSVPSGRQVRLNQAQLSAGVTAGDGTDRWLIEIKAGAVVLATWDSNAGVNGAITQNVPKALIKVASVSGAPLALLTAVFTKFNSGAALTAGHLSVALEVL